MIDWHAVSSRLAALAPAQPARLLSVTVPLARWPEPALPAADDWIAWQQPERRLRLLGFGKALAATSAGAGRFAALEAAQRGLAAGWHYPADAAAPLAFAGFAFAPQGGEPLPNAQLWVPELLLREEAGEVRLTLSCPAQRAGEAPARWRRCWQALTASAAVFPGLTFADAPNPLAEQAFLARGEAALAAIAAGEADKLVLSRAVRLRANAAIPAAPVLAALAARHPSCTTFGIAQAGRVFLGASPETLLRLDGARVAVDALAGTAWQEAALALDADKNHREHDFVARAVAEALGTLCREVAVPAAPEVAEFNALSHLRRRVTARRPAEASAFDLIARLHPTPAVGGAPAAALDWLDRHGEQRQAWYAGGIGWLDPRGDGDFVVGLRCGLLDGCTATLYAGAGFVAGSNPQQELAETEAKLSAMREALAGGRAAVREQAA